MLICRQMATKVDDPIDLMKALRENLHETNMLTFAGFKEDSRPDARFFIILRCEIIC